jgi:hypothetical protein
MRGARLTSLIATRSAIPSIAAKPTCRRQPLLPRICSWLTLRLKPGDLLLTVSGLAPRPSCTSAVRSSCVDWPRFSWIRGQPPSAGRAAHCAHHRVAVRKPWPRSAAPRCPAPSVHQERCLPADVENTGSRCGAAVNGSAAAGSSCQAIHNGQSALVERTSGNARSTATAAVWCRRSGSSLSAAPRSRPRCPAAEAAPDAR